MEKSQQRVIIYYFSLKGWGARKIQKKLIDTFGSDGYSQAQISPWLARFCTGDISCFDEARPGRPLLILGRPLKHFLEKFPFASARTITMQFNVSHSTVKDILSRELGLRKFSRRCVPHQLSDSQTLRLSDSQTLRFSDSQTLRNSFASELSSSNLRCYINIPSCSSKELQTLTSHGSDTLLNPTGCLQADVRK
jgi:hypothetical protein